MEGGKLQKFKDLGSASIKNLGKFLQYSNLQYADYHMLVRDKKSEDRIDFFRLKKIIL